MEDVGEVLLGGNLAEDRALAGARGGQRKRKRDGRLSDAPLAGDDRDPLVEEPWQARIISTCTGRKAPGACE